jgi:hypothetical protein
MVGGESMSTLKVNRIEPRTGDTVEIVGLEKPSKSILQVVSLTYSEPESFASGTPTKSNFKMDITRVNSDSDIVAIVNSNLYMKDGTKSFIRMFSYLYVDDVKFLDIGRVGSDIAGVSDKWLHLYSSGSFIIPSSSLKETSEISMWYAPDAANLPLQLNANSGASSMTIMEVSV